MSWQDLILIETPLVRTMYLIIWKLDWVLYNDVFSLFLTIFWTELYLPSLFDRKNWFDEKKMCNISLWCAKSYKEALTLRWMQFLSRIGNWIKKAERELLFFHCRIGDRIYFVLTQFAFAPCIFFLRALWK